MNKDLQELVWRSLPKEVREEIREMYARAIYEHENAKRDSLEEAHYLGIMYTISDIFGDDNAGSLSEVPSSAPGNATSSEAKAEPQSEECPKISQASSKCDISDCNSNTRKELCDALFALESASKSVRQALIKLNNNQQ